METIVKGVDLVAELSAKRSAQAAEKQRLADDERANQAALEAEFKRREPVQTLLRAHAEQRSLIAYAEKLEAACKADVEQLRDRLHTHIRERRELGTVYDAGQKIVWAEKTAVEIGAHLATQSDQLATIQAQAVQKAAELNLDVMLPDWNAPLE